MANVTASYNWVSGETVTPTKLNTTAAPTVVVADNEVTTAKILDANVTNAKLASDIDASKLTTGTLPIARIADGAVTQVKLASNVVGNGPAFRASATTTTSVASLTPTKITLATEDYDTNSNFASSRFTPTVAGYYLIIGSLFFDNVLIGLCQIFKNGTVHSTGSHPAGNSYASQVSDIIYLNGTTDYVELFGYHGATGSKAAGGNATNSYFSGCLLRAA
jgi:hypothetical protein